ncbi:MAG: ABC transporter ATP-binding protein [Oscillospiraceae bacterium]|nr:ABC transporter ATP-binding protein [Oscillospiraceae bacterium]
MRGQRGPGSGKDFRKPKDTKGTLIRLLHYVVSNKLLLVAVLVMMGISTGTNLAASYFLKPLIDDYIIPYIGESWHSSCWLQLGKQLLILLGIYLFGSAASYGQGILMSFLSQKAINKLRKDLFEKLQEMPISYYDANGNGEIMSRFTNDADNVQMAMEQTVTMFISSILTFVGTVAMMIYLNWVLFLITLAVLVVDYTIVRKISKKSKVLYKKQQKALGQVNAYVEEMVEGIKVVKAFNYEREITEEFTRKNITYRDNAMQATYIGMIIMPILNQVMGICYAITAVIGGLFVLNHVQFGGAVFTIGSLGVFLTYTKQVAQPINQVSNQIVTLLSAVAGAERIFAVMDSEPEVDEGKVVMVPVDENGKETDSWITNKGEAWKTPDGQLVPLKGHVQVEDIHFHYVEGKPVLKGVSVEALPGQKIAFVGSTGAGKTTITNLINRFYDVQEGRILYDGIDVKDIRKDDLRRSLVVILQDTHLFSGTIMENIRYGRLNATDEECIQAAKTANAYNFITSLPDGFNTYITGDGGSLSQGQRQLLNIARAAVAKPPVLIMDEATSSIDTRTEKEIEKGLDGLMEGRTVFVIAHRLSTVRNSDKIAVIEAGEIIEFGNHRELLAKGGRYYELYTGQHMLE